MIGRIFWSLWGLEMAAIAAAFIYFMFFDRKGWGPDGAVGAWLVFIPPIVLVGVAAIVWFNNNDAAKTACAIFLALPLAQLAIGPVYSRFQDYQTERSLDGDDSFRSAPQRKLAHAIRAKDAALVKTLIPLAGDVSKVYNDETLLRFSLGVGQETAPSLEIVQALLDAGANPNVPVLKTNWPLTLAISDGPRTVELLLQHGADPNRLDGAGRPLWWDAVTGESEAQFRTLTLLLDHGANLTLKDDDLGPIGWAAHFKNWPAVWLLMERGVEWKGQTALGTPFESVLTMDLQFRQSQRYAIPEEMAKVMKVMLPQ